MTSPLVSSCQLCQVGTPIQNASQLDTIVPRMKRRSSLIDCVAPLHHCQHPRYPSFAQPRPRECWRIQQHLARCLSGLQRRRPGQRSRRSARCRLSEASVAPDLSVPSRRGQVRFPRDELPSDPRADTGSGTHDLAALQLHLCASGPRPVPAQDACSAPRAFGSAPSRASGNRQPTIGHQSLEHLLVKASGLRVGVRESQLGKVRSFQNVGQREHETPSAGWFRFPSLCAPKQDHHACILHTGGFLSESAHVWLNLDPRGMMHEPTRRSWSCAERSLQAGKQRHRMHRARPQKGLR